MLQCENVYAGYDGAEILHDVSFVLPKGENLAILGANGAGKSTLMKCIAGLLPFKGNIEAAGIEIAKAKRKQVARHIGYLGQFSSAAYSYSVRDVVMMGRYTYMRGALFCSTSKEDELCVDEVLRALNLAELASRPVTELSGGQLQRVFLAQVLAQKPEIILLDEPTSHLDLRVQTEMIDYLNDWVAQEGRTVVGVMHDINLALRFASYVLLLKEGRVAAFGRAQEVVRPALLEETYGIDVAGYMVSSLEKWQRIAIL